MIALVLSTVFSAAFSVIVRMGQRRLCNMTALGAVNYITAAAYNLIALAATGFFAAGGGVESFHVQSILIGMGGGAAYVMTFFLLFRLMDERGVTISTAVLRLGALIPVVFSMVVWGERTTLIQMAGGLAALASLPMLSVKPSTPRAAGGGSVWLIASVFAGQGACLVATRLFNQTGIQGEDHLFLAALFATAASGASSVWILQSLRARRRPKAPDDGAVDVSVSADPVRALAPLLVTIGLGMALGLSNAFANQFLVIALTSVPGILAYPFYSAVGLLLTILFARIIWGEKINRLETIGICTACGAVVLMNLK